MKVKLLRFTADAELLCGTAAQTTIKTGKPTEILEKMDSETAKQKIKRVTGYGHASVIEHAYFTFSLEDVSRAMTHQLVRHRIASYTQQSQRYVTYDTLEKYVTPQTISNNNEARKTFDEYTGKNIRCLSGTPEAGNPKRRRTLHPAKRGENKHNRNHECKRTPPLLQPSMLRTGSMGNQTRGDRNAKTSQESHACTFRKLRTNLRRVGLLHGRKNETKRLQHHENQGRIPKTVNTQIIRGKQRGAK